MTGPARPVPNLKLAILDMAGTTIAVTDAVPEALSEAFAEADLTLPVSAIDGMRGRSKKEAIRERVAALVHEPGHAAALADAVLTRFHRSLLERYRAGVAPVPGAYETMRWLRAHGVAVVLTTGFEREIADLLLAQLGWGDDVITATVTADDVQRGRPHPDMILRAMHITDAADPDATLVAGDTSVDLQAAANAGVRLAVGVLSGAHRREQLAALPHAMLLESVAELPDRLRALQNISPQRANRKHGTGG